MGLFILGRTAVFAADGSLAISAASPLDHSLSFSLSLSLPHSSGIQADPKAVLPGRYIETYAQQSITSLPPTTIAQSNNPMESLEPFQ
jgi:hypothetical protein